MSSRSNDDSVILNVENLTKHFGGLTALNDINIKAKTSQIVGIIGPNGAGKTTLFNCLTGLYYPSDGEIFFKDKSIIPKTSTGKMKVVSNFSWMFFMMSVLWMPLFFSYYFPLTYYKVELGLLTLFIFFLRCLVIQGLKRYQIWAWGVMFVFLAADIFAAVWWLTHTGQLASIPGTNFSLKYVVIPWSLIAFPFGMVMVWQLFCCETRQLYGFKMGPDAICAIGIARTFQNIRLFSSLSVLDNIKIGAHITFKTGLGGALFRNKAQKLEEVEIEQEALKLLDFVALSRRTFDLAHSLAYGEQRRLEIARALASRPKIILLDEPAAGMNPQESAHLIKLIRKIRDNGVTILIIEHDMKVMMNLADIIYVLDHGVMIAEGTPDEIRQNPKVIEAYLGGSLAYAQTK